MANKRKWANQMIIIKHKTFDSKGLLKTMSVDD